MVVTFSAHAQQMLSIRHIGEEDVIKVIEHPEELFEDTEHDAAVAVGSLDAGSLVVIYNTIRADIKVITVYHTRKLEKLISTKIQRGAWRMVK